MLNACTDCGGRGSYWTEWSSKADANPELAALVIERPEPPDGTVLIRCPKCNAPSTARTDVKHGICKGRCGRRRILWLPASLCERCLVDAARALGKLRP